MDNKQHINIIRKVIEALKATVFTLVVLLAIVLYWGYQQIQYHTTSSELIVEQSKQPEIVNGIHLRTGLVADQGLELVIQNCTTCHSSKLITQNRMTKAGWESTIAWMQETQNLWDLGDNEQSIVDYLATNYAPRKKGRRARLENIEWYELD